MWILLENKHLFKVDSKSKSVFASLLPSLLLLLFLKATTKLQGRERVHPLYTVSLIDSSSSLLAGGDLSLSLSKAENIGHIHSSLS